ncbi:hypothetical protein CPJCM30710_33760 [Clostridium polyendosporum]|uniref:Spo0E like sporulation regulatory protein n=1 Tax=Clostridium polyendosporum TaxID=69208 RepID=A0A919S1V8_9CLOT|nr:hypothetical protein [Clostridium polyendosporum]GIM30710.1 hypothetical protein CPJCM30710_33760 [Clostridium polyendosporum]
MQSAVEKELKYVRNELDNLVKDGNLTLHNGKVLEINKILDELINIFLYEKMRKNKLFV